MNPIKTTTLKALISNPLFKNRTDDALLARPFVVYSRRRGGGAYFHGFTPWKQLSFSPSTTEEITTISTLCRVLTHFDRWISRILNQIPMTKLQSQYKHEKCRKFSVLRAYAGLYFERLSLKNILIISNSMNSNLNEHVIITNFHDFSKTFMI